MTKDKLINLLKAGRPAEALDQLIAIAENNDREMYNDLVLLSARLNGNSGMFNKGLLDYDQLKMENNKIFDATIDYIDRIAETEYFQKLSPEELEKKSAARPEKKVKILFVASNPVGTPEFQLEKEYLEIRRIFNRKRNEFEVTESFNTTLDQLFEVVRREKPDILHIAAPSTDRYLILHRPDDTIKSVRYDVLASAFSLFQPYVKFVFLNTFCSKVFLKKVSLPLRYAVGSRKLVDDNMSVLFSGGFYTAVAQGKSLEEAFSVGIEVVKNNEHFAEAEIPFVLYKDGLSNAPNDSTPEDFDFAEPEDIWDMTEG